MSITLTWSPFPEANVADYRVYRSMIGFVSPNVTTGGLDGLTLQLKMNGGSLQTITFDATTPTIDKINATLQGGQAYVSFDPGQLLLRSDVRAAPGSVEIVGGTALSLLHESPRLITEKSEDMLLGTIPALVDPTATVTFVDHDGALQDFYAVTTLDSFANESLKTDYRQAILSTGSVCILEGLIADLQGVRIPDAKVVAKVISFPYSPSTPSHITLDPIATLSGPDGRYSLVLLQGAVVELQIVAVGFTQQITVPAAPFAFVSDLLSDDAARLTDNPLITTGLDT